MFTGTPICFGADPKWLTLPITNVPIGATVRRRLRQKGAAVAFVKRPSGIAKFYLQPDGEALKLGLMVAANVKDCEATAL